MKKLVSILLIFLFFFSNITFAAQTKKKRKPRTKQKIELISKDKFILAGDFYIAPKKTNKPLIVLIHSFAMNAFCWNSLANELRLKGYNVLAMDLRGHGRSTLTEKLKFKSRYNFTPSDWQKLPSDVIDSINYVKKHFAGVNTNDVIIIGADIGANTAMLSGILMKKVPQKFVLISPMYEFKGLKMPVKTSRISDSKILMILAKSDKVLFDFNTKTKPKVIRYEKGGPGVQLIKVNPQAQNEIINFIEAK